MVTKDEKLQDLANILFENENLISEEQKKCYEKKVFDEIFTLKQQFLSYCLSDRKYAKFDRDKNTELAKKYMDKFLKKNKNIKSTDIPDFSVFDDLLFSYRFVIR